MPSDSSIRFYDWIRFHARHRPASIAFRSAETGASLTYEQTNRRIDLLATTFRQQYSARRGDRVLLIARSTIEAFETLFACARVGAIFVPLNWRLSVDELLNIADDAQPTVIVYQAEFKGVAQAIAQAQGCAIVEFDSAGDQNTYKRAIEGGVVDEALLDSVDWETPWVIMYTSGTTGQPKGVMMSYRMVCFNALNFIPVTGLSTATVFLCCLPVFHTGGLHCYATSVLYCGGTVVVMGDFDAQKAVQLMVDPNIGITHLFGVPTVYQLMSDLSCFEGAVFPALKCAGVGGAPATETLVDKWLSKGVPLQPAYGMTEIGPAIAMSNTERVRGKLRSVGQPVMNMEMRIVDHSNVPVADGQVGELQIKGPVLMTGYWNKPQQTESAFVDGWFQTGDAARLDEDGFLYIVDRYKDMFISGGENVFPTEVENAIAKHPGVSRCAVIGVSDAKWGEVGKAFVVLKSDQDVNDCSLNVHLSTLLARYKIPKSYVFVNDLPQTGSGKVKKQDLRAMSSPSNSSRTKGHA